MRFLLKNILLNFYFVLQIFTVSMGLLCGSISYAEKDPLKAFQNYIKEDIPLELEEVKKSVVNLFVTTDKGRDRGTGFILEDGVLVTNAHLVLDNSSSFFNQINSGHLSHIEIFQEGRLLDVQVTSIQAVDPVHDLALLNIKGSEIPPMIKKPKGEVDLKKEQLFFVGYPRRQLKAIGQKGPIEIFESKDHAEVHMPVLNGSVPGASGSPIVNKKGQLMGVLHSYSFLEKKIIFSNNDSLFSLRNAEYGVQCSKNKSIKKCFQQMEDFHLKEALKGDAFVQYKLNFYYDRNSRHAESLKWLKLAAQAGFVKAQALLGEVYYFKLGKHKEGLKWLKLASQNGYRMSMFQLGSIHYYGQGVPQNYNKAMEFFKAASSKKSISDSKFNVASMYARGEGVSKNYKEAIRWHESAIESGSLKSLIALGTYYYFGKGEISQDHKKAFQYFELAAQQGNSDAYLALGIMYDHGQGVPQDFEKAFEYFKLAAQQGNKKAQDYLIKTKNKKCIETFNKRIH